MQHVSLTPFGRQPVTRIDKRSLFNDLRTARARFGITDRDLSVLYALLPFLPAKVLEDGAALVVFPSNASLSDRAHGMAESTLRRHLAALVGAGLPGHWDRQDARPMRAALRRNLGAETPEALTAEAVDILHTLCAMLDLATEKTAGTAAHSGRHHASSNPDSSDLEPCQETAIAEPDALEPRRTDVVGVASTPDDRTVPQLPLHLVVKACPDLVPHAQGRLFGWRDLVATAAQVRGMMGISPSAWDEAMHVMGAEVAAVTVAAMLQRFDRIANPGGYLRALSAKAATGGFSPGPMVMALLQDGARSAGKS